MRIEIMGSAAGGGFPQWNCNCPNCRGLRNGTLKSKKRTQTQVAISADSESWFLLNASPDLRLQIEATPALHPRKPGRDSPIAGVVVTSADIDQVDGLLSLRELQRFRIYCTASIGKILREDNSMLGMLNRVPNQVEWVDFRLGEPFLLNKDKPVLRCTAFSLGNRYPSYVTAERAAKLNAGEALSGLMVEAGSKRLAYLPAVPAVSDSLLAQLESADVLLFDGTFWSDDELIRVQGSGATAREMGHIPISGEEGSLRRLAGLKHPRKIFLHVNNTNPILDESSAQYKEVREAGWKVAEDGWQLEL